jgi:hypothetical protein
MKVKSIDAKDTKEDIQESVRTAKTARIYRRDAERNENSIIEPPRRRENQEPVRTAKTAKRIQYNIHA